MKRSMRVGFTIVELLIVIVVIAILAGLTIVGYSNWHTRTAETTMRNDLQSLASLMEEKRNFSNDYPTTFPAEFMPSSGNVVQLVGSTSTYFCADIYNTKEPGIVLSYNSLDKNVRSYLCSGTLTGSPIGGTVPAAPRGVNLSGDFSNWQLSGTASISNGVLTLGSSGSVLSPPIRISAPTTIFVGGDLKAAQQSPHASLQPNGGLHVSTYYYGSDGSTAVANSSGHTSNGCAKGFPIGGWQLALTPCTFNGGPNVAYIRIRFNSTASGYASPDLQIMTPLLRVVD